MASPFVKSQLKRARELIASKDFEGAATAASEVLKYESANYNARVFLALALLNLGKHEEAEATYRKAIQGSPEQLLAWQGLSSLYEKGEQRSKYVETLRNIADLHYDAKDAFKCADALRKALQCQREHGTRQEAIEILYLLLPSSRYYDLLSTLPEPQPTQPEGSSIYEIQQMTHNSMPILLEIVASTETEEAKQIKSEIDRRRMRLTSGSAEETKQAVQREVMGKSKLPALYRDILQHPSASDETRREIESKLLHYLHQLLRSLPDPFAASENILTEAAEEQRAKELKKAGKSKGTLRTEIEELARGMVLLKLPDVLAWRVMLDWTDAASADSYNLGAMLDLVWNLPNSPLAPAIRGHLLLAGRKDVDGGDEEEEREKPANEKRERAFDLLRDGTEGDPNGLTTHLLAILRYSEAKEYDTVVELAERALSLIRETSGAIGRRLQKSQRCIEAALAVAFVHHEAPAHHRRALRLLDIVLDEQPDNVSCLIARGYVLTAGERWSQALAAFDRVLELTDDASTRLEVRGERAWSLVHLGRFDEAQEELHDVIKQLEERGIEAADERAQAWWRLGTCYWQAGDEMRIDSKHAYAAFINSIKASVGFAPAFTSLGKYYLEIVSPPDHSRASKCFQKAFELDPREDVAGRLLAAEFANEQQWDLVELIARRVIAGADQGNVEDRAAAGSALAKKHAWAWRAIGSAELNTERFPEAVHAFQSALRGTPTDVNAWLQLGLAYRGAGQYMASLKTFSRVLTLDPANWYAKFCAGDVQRTLGLLDAAVKTFNNLIEAQEGGAGVEAVLAETLLLRARAGLRTGHRGRAEVDIEEALRRAAKLIKSGQGLRVAWKVAADVLVELGTLEDVEAPSDIIAEVLDALTAEDVDGKMGDALEALPTVAEARIHAQVGSHGLLLLALSAYEMRLLLESVDDPTSGPSWFDLGLATHRSVEALTLAGLAERADNAPREAVFCFRQALRKEPRNPIYWTALGVAAGDLSPRLAQHALIKAAEINPRSAVAWTHLGLFYLQQADLGLANEAFLKAQTLDPEHAPAWLGQAALASLNEDETNAGMLIEHAWLLGGPPNVALAYGTRIANSPSPSLRAPDALFSLTRYLARRPRSNATALHAHGLLSERLGLLEQAVESLSLAVASLEAEYERTESATIEHRYALAQANLARVRLAISAYGEAEEAATSALGLLPEESASRGHAMLIKGLAQVLGENVEGLQTLEEAAGLAGAAGARSALVLAKALWQSGSEEQKEEAKRHLLAHIADAESGQPNLPAVASLGAAAMLTNDEDLLDAAVSEVANVSADKKALLDPTSDVTELLVSHALLKGDEEAALALRTKAVAAQPTSTSARRDLAILLSRLNQSEAALRTLSPQDHDAEALRAVLVGAADDAMRAVQKRPWDPAAWEACALACTVAA